MVFDSQSGITPVLTVMQICWRGLNPCCKHILAPINIFMMHLYSSNLVYALTFQMSLELLTLTLCQITPICTYTHTEAYTVILSSPCTSDKDFRVFVVLVFCPYQLQLSIAIWKLQYAGKTLEKKTRDVLPSCGDLCSEHIKSSTKRAPQNVLFYLGVSVGKSFSGRGGIPAEPINLFSAS